MNRVRAVSALLMVLALLPLAWRPVQPALADPVQWTPAGSLASARSGHTATLLDDGRVIVAGGFNDTTTFASVEIYDPAANSWSSSDPLRTARAGHSATRLLDGTVLVVGGTADGTALTSVERFDPTTGAWFPAASLGTARLGHSAVLLPDGSVLVAGGTGASGTALASVERYDPATDAWTPASDMHAARHYHTATLLSTGAVIVAGGQADTETLASVERYDYARDIWLVLVPLATPRASHAATALPNGGLLVVGGNGALGIDDNLASAERYSSATRAWSPAAPIPYARAQHSAMTLDDGSILVAGGFNTTVGSLTDSQRYLPATNTWEPTGALAAGRQGHVATLLADGDVLIVGGRANDSLGTRPLATAERFPRNDPPVARAPVASLRLGALGITTVPLAVAWPSAIDADGVTSYRLQRQVDGGRWLNVALATPTSQNVMLQLAAAKQHTFRVRATDTLGATGSYATGSEQQINVRQEHGSGFRYTGSWTVDSKSGYSGGSARHASAAGASVSLSFNGTSVAWVAGRGPNRGRARVQLDGVVVATIDLYAPTSRTRQIVFARNSLTPGLHTLRIVTAGTRNGVSTGTRVDLDAVVILR
jgi:N-acetylneuraminic acid mutarotase